MTKDTSNWMSSEADKSLLVDLQISAANKLMEALVASEKSMRDRVELLHEVLFELNVDGYFIYVNSAWREVSGFVESPIGKRLNDFIHKDDREILEHHLSHSTVVKRQKKTYSLKLNHAGGNILQVELSLSSMAKNYVGVIRDVTQHHQDQEKMRFLAHYDALTQLPNRTLFVDRLTQAMSNCDRKKLSLALGFIDLDNFKRINDSFGHEVGDQVLIHISNAIRDGLREGDSLSRVGGDEFIVLLTDLSDMADSKKVLERILKAASEPFTVDGKKIQISCSVGVNFYPQDCSGQEVLIRHADQAMYIAKQAGKNLVHYFDSSSHDAITSQKQAALNIDKAINRNEFEIYFLPTIDAQSLEVVGAEILSRWNHQTRGVLTPNSFLPHIFNDLVSIKHGEWVVRSAFEQLTKWKSVGIEIELFINIAGYHLQSDGFLSFIKKMLEDFPEVPPHQVGFEILETSTFEDPNLISTLISRLKALGFKFAIDDFGTGYSSLSFLKHLPVDYLKIDQSFIRDMLTNPDDMAIVKSVIALSKAFNRRVVAEGVEKKEVFKELAGMGCDFVQGYFFSKPLTASQFEDWYQNFNSHKKSWH